jgi:mannitol operon repressor
MATSSRTIPRDNHHMNEIEKNAGHSPESVVPSADDMLDELLRKTPTPGHRLFAVISLLVIAHDNLADAVAAGEVKKEQLEAAKEASKKIHEFIRDPPVSFVELISSLYKLFEWAAHSEGVSDEHRALLPTASSYIHEMMFSPPAGAAPGAEQIAADLKKFDAFVAEFKEETDRGAALVGAALVDNLLEELLRSHFLNVPATDKLLDVRANGAISGFSARIKLCYVLGLVTEVEYKECEIIREVRNRFAHRLHGLKFSDQEIADRCKTLKGGLPVTKTPRQQFINSVVTLCMVLWYRSAHASPYQAVERQWPWHLSFGK